MVVLHRIAHSNRTVDLLPIHDYVNTCEQLFLSWVDQDRQPGGTAFHVGPPRRHDDVS